MRYLLLVTMACGLVIGTSCGQKTQTGVHVDAAFRELVPPDATMLAGVDLERLRQTPLYARYGSRLSAAGIDSFTERFGIDPRRDVAAVLLAANAKGRLVLVRGRFTEQQVQPKLVSVGAQRTSYKGHVLFGDARPR